MKNIIVAVDFSDCSINALEHAIQIAKKGNFDIILTWVNNPTTTKVLLNTNQSADITGEIESQFKKLIKEYSGLLPSSKIEYKIREGKIYHQVAMQARESKALLVVTGTHGTSGFEEFWIGSNANKIVSAAPCPVITIRAGVRPEKELKKILVPIDSSPETRQKASFTELVASLFEAEVHVLALYTTGIKAIQDSVNGYADQVIRFFREQGLTCFSDSLRTSNLVLDTIDYAEQIGANMISIMTEQETKTSNLWLGPYAQQMVNRSPIPVLSIHPIDLDFTIAY